MYARWKTLPSFAASVDEETIARLRADPDVLAVDDDAGVGPAMSQSLPIIGTPAVRAMGLTGAGHTIAVLDTGIDRVHPDFAGAMAAEACFCTRSDGTPCCPTCGRDRSRVLVETPRTPQSR